MHALFSGFKKDVYQNQDLAGNEHFKPSPKKGRLQSRKF
jgi:hypothetical protein